MRAPLSWLRELTPLATEPTDRASVAELASELDALGLVVDRVDWVGRALDEVVVARVLELSPIEGADRIRRVVVDAGDDEVEVVCGAWNFKEGDLVALALVGTELPGGMRIERRKLRGVTSNGMLCSPSELALSPESEGILVLGTARQEAVLGAPLSEQLGFGPDVVFDLEIEANRPDCLSMVGIARDLAARYGLPLFVPEPSLAESGEAASLLATVEVADEDLCFHLLAKIVTSVSPVQSQPVVQRRLVLCGMRPIGHVVDASNYAMLEFGQPTHPYDLDSLGGGGLRVRAAHSGETLVTLDGVTRILGGRPARGDDMRTSKDGLICNANDVPVGVAGVIGGRTSEVADGTGRVLLEVASFDAVSVGRTARYLGLRTEASVRFERGVDPGGLERAASRVCQLIVDAAAAAGAPLPLVARGTAETVPRPFSRRRIAVRPGRVNALLGLDLPASDMAAFIAPAGFEWQESRESPEVIVPSWRPDVDGEADVAEEIARLYGYDRIPRAQRRSPLVGRLDDRQTLRRRLRSILTGLGADEASSSSIVDPAEQRAAGFTGKLLSLANPMAAEESVLRATLLAGLVKALRLNSGHRNPEIRLFEIGDVFSLVDGEVEEHERIALLLARGDDDAHSAVNAWRLLADALGIERVEISQDACRSPSSEQASLDPALDGLHPSRRGLLVTEPAAERNEESPRAVVGALGEIDPSVLAAFEVSHGRVGWLELNLDALASAPRRPAAVRPASRYPSSDMDLAFLLDEAIPAGRLERVLREAGGEMLESLRLFDVYRGVGVPDGTRSLGYRLRVVAKDHTLTDAELSELQKRCIDAVEAALPARLRRN